MGAPSTNDRAPGEGFLVLWAGSAEIAERDTQVELRRAGLRVEVVEAAELSARVNERAPDLVVLGGELGEAPEALVAELRGRLPAAAAPVVALAPPRSASPRPRARFGLAARLDRDEAPPALAARIAATIEGLSGRPAVWRTNPKDGDLALVAAKLAASSRCGVLASKESGAIVVDASGKSAPATLPVPVAEAGFHERPPGRVRVLQRASRAEETAPSLDGVRVLIVDPDDERRQRMARRLEQTRAEVRTTGVVAQAVHASRAHDPSVIVVASPALASSALSPLWTEPRLSVAPLLVLDGEALDAADAGVLIAEVAALARRELELSRALRDERAVAERLETLGPARWLKLLGRCKHDVTLRVFAALGRVRVDLASGRIQGASFRPAEQAEVVEGRAAVDVFMALPFGRVLAGPPAALAALEGVSARRKPSVVGRLEHPSIPAPQSKAGLVAEEVVVKRTDATKLPLGASKRPAAGREEAEEEPQRVSLVPLGDLADGEDVATSTYAPGTLAELRSTLRPEPEAPTTPPPGRAAKVRRPPAEEVAPAAALEEIEPPRAGPAEPPRAEAREAPRAPEVAPAPAEQGAAPTPAPSAPSKSSNAPWFAAGVALALAVGAWAAWRLHGEDARPRATDTGPTIAQGPAADEARAAPEEASSEREAAQPEPRGAPEAPGEPAGEAPSEPVAAPSEPVAPSEPLEEAAPSEPAAVPTPSEPVEEPAPSTPEPAASGAPASAGQLIAEAIAAAGRRDYALSEAMSRRALELSPRNPRAGYRLAVALFQQQRYDEALRQCDAVSEWDPTDPFPLALRGDILSRRGRFLAAARAYQRALEVDPEFGPAQRSLERLRERGVEVP